MWFVGKVRLHWKGQIASGALSNLLAKFVIYGEPIESTAIGITLKPAVVASQVANTAFHKHFSGTMPPPTQPLPPPSPLSLSLVMHS